MIDAQNSQKKKRRKVILVKESFTVNEEQVFFEASLNFFRPYSPAWGPEKICL